MLSLIALLISTSVDEPFNVEQAVVASRKGIKTMRATLNIRCKSDSMPVANFDHKVEVWVDGDRLRADWYANTVPNGRKFPYSRQVTCKGCSPDGRLVVYGEPSFGVVYHPADLAAGKQEGANLTDPRRFGLHTSNIFSSASQPFNGEIGSPLFKYLKTEQTSLDGKAAVVIHATQIKTAAERRLWLSTNEGGLPVRIECTGGTAAKNDPNWYYRVVSTPDRDPKSSQWYIRKYVLTDFRKGATLFEETGEVVSCELNQPIDPTVFSPAGFGLPIGTPVVEVGSNRMRYWNGSEVVNQSPVRFDPGQAPPPVPESPVSDPERVWVYVASGAGAVGVSLLVIALVRRFRSRPA